jgi:peptidoglycan/xylan/chitin deacetylase (PgdA/CDA1 family)
MRLMGLAALGALGALDAGYMVGHSASASPPAPMRGVGRPRTSPHPYPKPFALPPHFIAPHLALAPTPGGMITGLPGDAPTIALTVDDGNDSAVVAAYAKFSYDTGMRITFFLNGSRRSWTDNAAALRPLVASGQVQLANHTWSHPDLRSKSRGEIVDELMTNHDFIQRTYGVDARPYFRPPYGYHDGRVDEAAASVGYTVPVLWYGSLSDSTLITDDQLMDSANRWMLPKHIVIGHANYATVTRHFDELVGIIRARGLIPVTLDDVFARP